MRVEFNKFLLCHCCGPFLWTSDRCWKQPAKLCLKLIDMYPVLNETFLLSYFKGCTKSKHSNIKPPEPEKTEEKPLEKDEVYCCCGSVPVFNPIYDALHQSWFCQFTDSTLVLTWCTSCYCHQKVCTLSVNCRTNALTFVQFIDSI